MLALIAASLVTAHAPPANSAAAVARPPAPIVVIGRRIRQAEDALDACLARRCPTDQDIDASLALAESQILAGKYREARTTLLAALGRNKDQARRYPVPVSDLYRANGRVAAHLGFDKDYYASTWGIYRTLKAGLPSDEYRHFSALMEVAEMMGRTRGHERARLYYESIAREARKARRPDIAAMAELRSVLNHFPDGTMRDSTIRRIAASRDPEMRAAALEAKLALARRAYEHNDADAAAALQREFAAMDIKRPILIWSPPYAMLQHAQDNGSMFSVPMLGKQSGGMTMVRNLPYAQWSTTSRIPPVFDDMWLDVRFAITPEGKVSDLKVTRSRGDIFWAKPLLASIRARRYTPGRASDPAAQRIERYTYTSAYEAQTGTRFTGRSPDARVEYFDLSPMGIATPQ